jgi:hypothetical protein
MKTLIEVDRYVWGKVKQFATVRDNCDDYIVQIRCSCGYCKERR